MSVVVSGKYEYNPNRNTKAAKSCNNYGIVTRWVGSTHNREKEQWALEMNSGLTNVTIAVGRGDEVILDSDHRYRWNCWGKGDVH
jgi:hypothetical protein